MSKETDRMGELDELAKIISKLEVIKTEARCDYDLTVLKFRELHELHNIEQTEESLNAVLTQCGVCADADFFVTEVVAKAIISANEEFAALISQAKEAK